MTDTVAVASPAPFESAVKVGQMDYMGLPLVVETLAGDTRKGKDDQGREWSMWVSLHYGYIEGTVSMEEGDELDFFLEKEALPQPMVYIIDMVDETSGEFDEEKVFLGFQSLVYAQAEFKSNYSEAKMGVCYAMTIEDFKTYLDSRLQEADKMAQVALTAIAAVGAVDD